MVVMTDIKELCNEYGIELKDMELISKRFIEYLIPEVRDEMRDDDVMLAEYRAMKVGYWRKANQIHKWFVDNVQDGVDNCATYPVTYEQLQELLSLVNEVLKNHKLAAELLPTETGFFFGSDEYGEWYFTDLEETKRIIEATFNDVGRSCQI